MIKLVGYEEKKGNFTNKDTGELVEYNNTELHLVTDEKEGIVGLCTITAKAKTNDLRIVGNAKSLDDALNKEILPIMDVTKKKDENGKMTALISKIMVM